MNPGAKAALLAIALSAVAAVGSVVYRVNSGPEEVDQTPQAISTPAQSVSPKATAKPQADKVISTGTFGKLDALHFGSGEAQIVETSSGAVVRLKNFSVNNGPDLFVYVSKNSDVMKSRKLGDHVSLGKLKAENGNQEYRLPADYQDYQSVVIWCRAFNVPWTIADQKSV